MAKLDLAIGAQVHCTDKPCGKLAKIVVDPTTQQVSDLIFEQGLLFKTMRVVPVSMVAKTTPDEVYLRISGDELDSYAEYREVEFQEPASDVRRASPAIELMPGGDAISPVMPMIRRRLREGVATGRAILDHGTSVENLSEKLGRVDHVVLDESTGRIVELVMRRGFFPEYNVIPITSVEEITDDVVLVSIFEHEIDALRRPELRPDEELVATLQESLQRANPPVFAGVEVAAHAATVRLSGHVASNELKLHAEELAYLVPGVIDVQNELAVTRTKERPTMTVKSQENIVYRIGATLAADPRTKDAVIEVIEDRGLVTLQGEVGSVKVRNAAQEIAARQEGVATVINELVVAAG